MIRQIYDGALHDTTDMRSADFLAVNSCGAQVNTTHRTVREQGRKDYLLLYVESGRMTAVTQKGEVSLLSGGFALYPPLTRQEYYQEGGCCYWVHFSGETVEEVLAAVGLSDMTFSVGYAADARVVRAFERMLLSAAQEHGAGRIRMAAELLTALSFLGENGTALTADERLLPVILHMNKHFAAPASLDNYAEMVGVSPARFSHLFKETVGMPPYAYLLGVRLRAAAELLLATDAAVKEVAVLCGFSDPLYFSRAFKHRYGVSPDGYRKRERQTEGYALV